MPYLSKSKLIAFKQCPKRLWLEVKKPSLKDDSGSEAAFRRGHEVGGLAQRVFDPDGKGTLIDVNELGWIKVYDETARLLKLGDGPIFEAALKIEGAMAFADIMLPDWSSGELQWQMIEVKSSTGVKDYHRNDLAAQVYIARQLSVPISFAGVACIDTNFVYPGNGGYEGLFAVEDLTEETFEREFEVREWIAEAQRTASEKGEPDIDMGPHCSSPFVCGFWNYCSQDLFQPEHHVSILPRLTSKRSEAWEDIGIVELRDTPDDELNPLQLRVKNATLSGETYFDAKGASEYLSHPEGKSAYFLDFETVNMAIPTWAGTRPYEQLPFQFSLHEVTSNNELRHKGFLDVNGKDPRPEFVDALIAGCGRTGPIYVYNASFEKRVIRNLAEVCPNSSDALNTLLPRVVDLLPIVRNTYYHPSQRGSWSLKAVLPTICPELAYDDLEGIQHGGAASEAFTEALKPETSQARRKIIDRQLREYCKMDTLATVKLFEFLKDSS